MNKSASLLGCNVGDKIVTPESRGWGGAPQVDYRIFTVAKRTATQLVALPEGEPGAILKARLADGKVIGESYRYANPATPEILQLVAEQRAMRERYHTATAAVDDLIDQPLHRLKLTIPQLEKLAQAWGEVKAMAVIPEGAARVED